MKITKTIGTMSASLDVTITTLLGDTRTAWTDDEINALEIDIMAEDLQWELRAKLEARGYFIHYYDRCGWLHCKVDVYRKR